MEQVSEVTEFKEALKKWNKGIERGSQNRFANALGLGRTTVTQWVNNTSRPGPDIREKVAQELGVEITELMRWFEQKKNVANKPLAIHYIPIYGKVRGESFRLDFSLPPEGFLPIVTAQENQHWALGVVEEITGQLVYYIFTRQTWANEGDLVCVKINDHYYTIKNYNLEKYGNMQIVGRYFGKFIQ